MKNRLPLKKKISLLFVLMLSSLALISQGENPIPPESDSNSLHIFLAALLGAILQELLYYYELRRNPNRKNKTPELNDRFFWVITSSVVILASIGTWFYFTNIDEANYFTIATFAAGFPRLFKGAAQNIPPPTPQSEKTLESFTPRSFTIRDYLMI